MSGSVERIDLPALFARAAATWGEDGQALVAYRTADLEAPRSVWSRGRLADDVRRTAELLREMGLGPGNRIAILMPTVPEIHPLLWGGMSVAGVVLVNPLLQIDHIAHLIDQSDATLLCVPTPLLSSHLSKTAAQIARGRPGLQVMHVGPDGDFPACLDVLDVNSDECYARPADAVAALFHTGGTTGRPKIAPLSLANLLHAARMLTPVLDFAPHDRFFSPLPLFHIAGAIVGGLAPLLAGTTIVLPPPDGLRDPAIVARCWTLLERERVTMMVAVPTSLAALCDVPLGEADLSLLDYVLTGTSPLPEETARRFSALTGKEVHTGYGMTESAGVIAYAPRSEAARTATVGKPLPGIELAIAPVTERSAVGRVLVRGPNVFAGYLGGVERIEKEWFDTGDLGVIDDKGWLTLTGRSKDLIIRGGHNIDPAVIEEVAAKHPAVMLAAAIGQIDDYAGEVPALYVQLKHGSDEASTLDELAAIIAREVAEPPARPRAIHAIESMPITAVGKIYKPALRIDAASRRVVRLLDDRAIHAQSVDVEEDDGGSLVVRVLLRVEDGGSQDEIRGLIARFPVQVTVRVATLEAADPD